MGIKNKRANGSNECSCCSGISIQTPARTFNRPGLDSISYRVGDHRRFFQTMLSQIQVRPELRRFTSREDSDFSISLLDAWALIADILAFYQERLANESYLRTARERRSALELARLLGYGLSPGVAASAYLAFDLEDAPGSPGTAIIDVGTKVQSTPGQDEKAQIFETIERLEARAEWSAIRPKQAEKRSPGTAGSCLYLKGIANNLKRGDGLLIVEKELELTHNAGGWDFRKVSSVAIDPASDRTIVILDNYIKNIDQPEGNCSVYAMRTRAAIFGHNALKPTDPNEIISEPTTSIDASKSEIHLDSVYSQIVQGSWIVLTTGMGDSFKVEPYWVNAVGEETLAQSGIAAKVTTLGISGKNLSIFCPSETTVHAQSEEIALADTPLQNYIYGNRIKIDRLSKRPVQGQKLAVRGKRARVRINLKALTLTSVKDPKVTREFQPGDELILTEAPAIDPHFGDLTLHLMEDRGFEGQISDVIPWQISYVPAAKSDLEVSEIVELKNAEPTDDGFVELVLAAGLKNIYDRASMVISANLARATHGETTSEVLGSGDAGTMYQCFSLKQLPLTYISSPTASGIASTMRVWVNDMLWEEIPNLFANGLHERIYAIRNGDPAKTIVQFGSRLPTGQENVRATYRRGLGAAGNVKSGQLNILMTRVAGVKGAWNPLPAEGGKDPQTLEDARLSAPLTVLTLDRIVSLQDYEDFARSFGGIVKANATWTWNGTRRGVLLTAAGPSGSEVNPGSSDHDNLLAAMLRYGDPRVPLTIRSGRVCTFKLRACIIPDPNVSTDAIKSAVEAALRNSYSFEAREFGQPVTLGEIISVIQKASGVIAVNVEALYRSDAMQQDLQPILEARMPRPGSDDIQAAEILIIDPSPADLVVIS